MQKIIYHSVILLVSALLLIFFANTIANDFLEYEKIYDEYANFKGGFKEMMISFRFEPGFAVLYYYLGNFLSAPHLFFTLAIPAMTIKYLLFLKHLKYPVAAWFLYVLLFLPSLDSSQLRTSLASTMIIYILLSKTSNFGYVFAAITASMFHYIGAIILLIRLYRYSIFGLLLILIASVFFDDILLLLSGPYFKLDYFIVELNGPTVNYFSTNAAAHLILSFYCFMAWRGFTDTQKKGAFLICTGIVIYYLLGYNPGVAHRIREISLLGIFPLLFFIKVRFTYNALLASIGLFYITLYNCVLVIRELIVEGHLV